MIAATISDAVGCDVPYAETYECNKQIVRKAATAVLEKLGVSHAGGIPAPVAGYKTQGTIVAWAASGATPDTPRRLAHDGATVMEQLFFITGSDDTAGGDGIMRQAAALAIILYRLAGTLNRDLLAQVDREMTVNRLLPR